MAEQLNGLPLYFQPQKIKNAGEYVAQRITKIREKFSGNFPPPKFEDKSDDFLKSLAEDELNFVILSFDIANSTKLITTLNPEVYNRLISIVLYELSKVIPLFHGHVLKYTGDGLIAYFPAPSFITKNDLAIDCALTMIKLVFEGLNPVIKEIGYDAINIRIGLDSGAAFVTTIGSPDTKQHKDIIGAVVSLATKIQSLAPNGTICLGETTYKNLHTDWRIICEELRLPKDWRYKKAENSIYKVFIVKTG